MDITSGAYLNAVTSQKISLNQVKSVPPEELFFKTNYLMIEHYIGCFMGKVERINYRHTLPLRFKTLSSISV